MSGQKEGLGSNVIPESCVQHRHTVETPSYPPSESLLRLPFQISLPGESLFNQPSVFVWHFRSRCWVLLLITLRYSVYLKTLQTCRVAASKDLKILYKYMLSFTTALQRLVGLPKVTQRFNGRARGPKL